MNNQQKQVFAILLREFMKQREISNGGNWSEDAVLTYGQQDTCWAVLNELENELNEPEGA